MNILISWRVCARREVSRIIAFSAGRINNDLYLYLHRHPSLQSCREVHREALIPPILISALFRHTVNAINVHYSEYILGFSSNRGVSGVSRMQIYAMYTSIIIMMFVYYSDGIWTKCYSYFVSMIIIIISSLSLRAAPNKWNRRQV